jgi:hypothetical protein
MVEKIDFDYMKIIDQLLLMNLDFFHRRQIFYIVMS